MGGRGSILQELATVIFRERRPESIEALLHVIAVEEHAGVQVNLLEGMLRASRKRRPLLLEREPEVFAILRESRAPEVVSAAKKVAALITWPGKSSPGCLLTIWQAEAQSDHQNSAQNDLFFTILRSITHFKLSATGNSPVTAKAYMECRRHAAPISFG